jgi:hypothetical protein
LREFGVPTETPPPLPHQEGMGCFAKGCLVVVVVVGAWFFYGKAVAVFTFAQPADVRIEQVSDADLGAAEQSANFWKHVKTIGLDRDKLVIVTQRL